MNKNLIIAIIIVVIIAIVGAFVLTHQGSGEKINTKINWINDENATFKNGDQLQFELKDANGSALAGQQLNISYSNDENQSYTVVTDSNGKYSLILDNLTAGDNTVIVKYAGNDKYNDYELQKAIIIE
ncbi:Ig-like domain-containing protein [uncultured Methanobrevibacter sp.]|uniref:Ig-like domain-containing protein n=1 Tax=uncultured Methanobrevibacter sp. TaxID=253161 RepID=UPI0025DA39DD|nr:Ig-like domain-containing protein [uncultured Methanobrevibacter sp.]